MSLVVTAKASIPIPLDVTFRVEPVEAPRKTIDVSGFAGKAPGIALAPREDFEERPSTIALRKAQSGQ